MEVLLLVILGVFMTGLLILDAIGMMTLAGLVVGGFLSAAWWAFIAIICLFDDGTYRAWEGPVVLIVLVAGVIAVWVILHFTGILLWDGMI